MFAFRVVRHTRDSNGLDAMFDQHDANEQKYVGAMGRVEKNDLTSRCGPVVTCLKCFPTIDNKDLPKNGRSKNFECFEQKDTMTLRTVKRGDYNVEAMGLEQTQK